jgi:hypothetical protein
VDGVVLEEMGQALGVGQIVDADDLDLAVTEGGAEEDTADATKPVDADSNAHGGLLAGDCG